MKNFKLDKDFDKLTGSWDDIVNNYDKIKDELEKHEKENSAKILTDGNIFDKVLVCISSPYQFQGHCQGNRNTTW